jgi:putative addiction module component (TIGR02574 family)
MPTPLELIEEIEKLPPRERIQIVGKVILDTIKPDAEIEKIWVREAEARWRAFEQGTVETVTYAEVMAPYRKP